MEQNRQTPDAIFINGIQRELKTSGPFTNSGRNLTAPIYLSEAQRDYALHAVSCHEQLVAALEAALEYLPTGDERSHGVYVDGRAALTEAKKGGAA